MLYVPQEKEQMQCYNLRMVEILKGRQQQEKNRLPKIQRSEAKTRMAMFKKNLRINSSGSASEDKEKIKQVGCILSYPPAPLFQCLWCGQFASYFFSSLQFSQQEEKRQKAERQHQQLKHENQMREMTGQCESNIRELQQLQVNHLSNISVLTCMSYIQCLLGVLVDLLLEKLSLPFSILPDKKKKNLNVVLQNEKCHLLVENETQRLKHLDEQQNQLLKEWRDQLKMRKTVRLRSQWNGVCPSSPHDHNKSRS